MNREAPTSFRAQRRWRGILLTIGLPEKALTGKHGPCPICQDGKDRFRFDDKDGRGTWFCNVCGAGDGVQMVERFKGLATGDALKLVDEILGTRQLPKGTIRPELTPEQVKANCRKVLARTKRVTKGDPVDVYLTARKVGQVQYPATLGTARALRYTDGTEHPAMVAVITAPDGENISLHRTFLDGESKLAVPDCRKVMPGKLKPGSAVRLSPLGENDDVLGVAEGIETALSASAIFNVPVWAVLNTSMMRTFQPPPQIQEVVIFADNDVNGAGQAAADELRQRLEKAGLEVTVCLPAVAGTDWNDELRNRA